MGSQLDILPTVLGLLDLRCAPRVLGPGSAADSDGRGFAVSVAGRQIRWRDRRYLVDDGVASARPLLCEPPADPACRVDTWPANTEVGEALKRQLWAYLSLSQTLMYGDRVYPRRVPAAVEGGLSGANGFELAPR